MTELWAKTATELAQDIADGSISSVEATQSALARMEAVNPGLNAVVDGLADEAMAAAQAADASLKAHGPSGPLHGVPVTVKVNVDYKGHATTNGVVAFKDMIAQEDGTIVTALRASSAIIIGRTNTPCFSMRWSTENELHGATLNPHNETLTAGGSSGGAGSATAAGIGAMGHGNDIGGSVRFPAYCCGIYGLRPTTGVVPAYNPSQSAERPVTSMLASVQGPLARSVYDIAISMKALVVPDARDPLQVPCPEGLFDIKHMPCKVAMMVESDDVETDPEVTAAIRTAGAMLSDAGYVVEEVSSAMITTAARYWHTVLTNDMRAGLQPAIDQYGDAAIKKMSAALLAEEPDLDRDGFILAFAERSKHLRDWQMFMQDYPLILTGSSWAQPFLLAEDQMEGADISLLMRKIAPMMATPGLSLPGLSAPMGVVNGHPTGVQLIAPRYREDLLLSSGAVLERANGGPVAPVTPAF